MCLGYNLGPTRCDVTDGIYTFMLIYLDGQLERPNVTGMMQDDDDMPVNLRFAYTVYPRCGTAPCGNSTATFFFNPGTGW